MSVVQISPRCRQIIHGDTTTRFSPQSLLLARPERLRVARSLSPDRKWDHQVKRKVSPSFAWQGGCPYWRRGGNRGHSLASWALLAVPLHHAVHVGPSYFASVRHLYFSFAYNAKGCACAGNPVTITTNTPHRCSTTASLETCPFYEFLGMFRNPSLRGLR